MKQAIDFIQILLSLGFTGSALVAILLFQSIKTARQFIGLIRTSIGFLRRTLLKVSFWNVALISFVAFWMTIFNTQVSDGLQFIEQAYFAPLYVNQDTSAFALSVYERELEKHCSESEAEIVKQRTREMAAKLGSTPLSIYEVAYSECGMDPFRVRTDGVAAGWIQFTRAGLQGLDATLYEVKQMCEKRDTRGIMDLTERYLIDRAVGKKLPTATDVYVCVFAPGYVGAPASQVLYAGYSNPAYQENIGLDGYFLNGTKIIRLKSACDGMLTVQDLSLALAAKKAALLHG